jgi:hypothetical protein
LKKAHPEEAITNTQLGAFDRLPLDGQLLTQRQIFKGHASLGNEQRSKKQYYCFQNAHAYRSRLPEIGHLRPLVSCMAIAVTPWKLGVWNFQEGTGVSQV